MCIERASSRWVQVGVSFVLGAFVGVQLVSALGSDSRPAIPLTRPAALLELVGSESGEDRMFELAHRKDEQGLIKVLTRLLSEGAEDAVDPDWRSSILTSLLSPWGDRDIAAVLESRGDDLARRLAQGLCAWRLAEAFPRIWACLPREPSAWVLVALHRRASFRRLVAPETGESRFPLTLFDVVAAGGGLPGFFKDHEGCWVGDARWTYYQGDFPSQNDRRIPPFVVVRVPNRGGPFSGPDVLRLPSRSFLLAKKAAWWSSASEAHRRALSSAWRKEPEAIRNLSGLQGLDGSLWGTLLLAWGDRDASQELRYFPPLNRDLVKGCLSEVLLDWEVFFPEVAAVLGAGATQLAQPLDESIPRKQRRLRALQQGVPRGRVRVMGAVRHPNVIIFEKGMTLSDALVSVGGFADEAYRRSVNLVRHDAIRRIDLMKISGSPTPDVVLEPRDLIDVPSNREP